MLLDKYHWEMHTHTHKNKKTDAKVIGLYLVYIHFAEHSLILLFSWLKNKLINKEPKRLSEAITV